MVVFTLNLAPRHTTECVIYMTAVVFPEEFPVKSSADPVSHIRSVPLSFTELRRDDSPISTIFAFFLGMPACAGPGIIIKNPRV